MALTPARKMVAPWLAAIVAALWLVAAALGQRVMLNYEYSAAAPGTPPEKWPVATKVPRTPGLPTILVVAHPRCPCSRATVAELARLMALLQNSATATVIFARPSGFSQDWQMTDLWWDAAR